MPAWTTWLAEEDWGFVHRFLLASGSLKALAEEYGISYPTVRARLDRLIEKVRASDRSEGADDFTKLVRMRVIDGQVAPAVAKEILEAHRRSKGDGK